MQRFGFLFIFANILIAIETVAAYTLNVDNIDKGEFSYRYDTDAISEDRMGKVDENGDLVVSGSYTFYIDDTQYTVTYFADKNGYHPTVTVNKIPNLIPSVPFSLPSRALASILG